MKLQVLSKLGIPVGVNPNEELSMSNESGEFHENIQNERSWLVSKWHQFDVRYMKPLFTVSGGSFHGEVPTCRGVVQSCCGVQHTGSTEDVYRVDVDSVSVPPDSSEVEMEETGNQRPTIA